MRTSRLTARNRPLARNAELPPVPTVSADPPELPAEPPAPAEEDPAEAAARRMVEAAYT